MERHAKLFEQHPSTRTVVLDLNAFIHPEVRKIYPGALAPEFRHSEHGNQVHLEYSSPRQL